MGISGQVIIAIAFVFIGTAVIIWAALSTQQKKEPKNDRGMNVYQRILIGVGSWFGIAVIFTLLLGGLRGTDMAFIFYSLNVLNFIYWVWFIFTGKLLIISNFRSSSSAKEVKVLNAELEELKAQDEIEKLKKEIAELKKKSDKD